MMIGTMTCPQLDTELTQLTFSGNKVTKQESEYLGQLLRTNRFLTHLVSTGRLPDVIISIQLTPSLPQPVKFPGWKVHTYTPANSIFDGPITNLPSIRSVLIEL